MSESFAQAETELVTTRPDKRRPFRKDDLPGQGKHLFNTTGRGASVWGTPATLEFEPVGVGIFPKGFLEWACRQIGCSRAEVLHMCSGGLRPGAGGTRVDIRSRVRPDVAADARSLPFRANTFSGALIDPPWSLEYAEELYGTDYPRPSHLLREAERVVKQGCRFGLLHFFIAASPSGSQIEKTVGITSGAGYRIRALTIYRKKPPSLFE